MFYNIQNGIFNVILINNQILYLKVWYVTEEILNTKKENNYIKIIPRAGAGGEKHYY